MSEPEFAELFRKASAEATGGRAYLPGEMVDQWNDVVGLIEDGYGDSLDEYVSDLGIRRSIEATLDSDLLTGRTELTWIREHVAAVDERLRGLLQGEPLPRSDGLPWWQRFPPRYAGPELAADYLSSYGVRVDVHEN